MEDEFGYVYDSDIATVLKCAFKRIREHIIKGNE